MAFKSSSIGVTSTEPLTVLQILCKALQLPTKASKVFFPLLVFSLLSSTSILLYFTSTISPVLQDLLSKLSILFKDHHPPPKIFKEIARDFKDLARLAAVITPGSFIVIMLLSVAAVYTFATAYSNKSLSCKQLIARVSRRWYETSVTSLYVFAFGIGYLVVSSFVVGTTLWFSDDDDVTKSLTAVGTSTSLFSFAVMLLLYLATRGSLSLVIAVIEETWGIGALSMSVVLFIGNKQRGTVLTTVLMSVRLVIYGILGMVIFPCDHPKLGDDEDRKLILLGAAVLALWELYSLAAYTVFYYECRKSHGLEDVEGDEEQQGFIYATLPAVKINTVI